MKSLVCSPVKNRGPYFVRKRKLCCLTETYTDYSDSTLLSCLKLVYLIYLTQQATLYKACLFCCAYASSLPFFVETPKLTHPTSESNISQKPRCYTYLLNGISLASYRIVSPNLETRNSVSAKRRIEHYK